MPAAIQTGDLITAAASAVTGHLGQPIPPFRIAVTRGRRGLARLQAADIRRRGTPQSRALYLQEVFRYDKNTIAMMLPGKRLAVLDQDDGQHDQDDRQRRDHRCTVRAPDPALPALDDLSEDGVL